MKKKINLFESLQSDDLTPDLQMLENLCGIETVRKLIENYSGMYFYIPKVTSLKSFIYRIVGDNKSMFTNKELSNILGVSEQYIRVARRDSAKLRSDRVLEK